MPVGLHVKSGRRATAGGGTGVREAADELFLMTDLFPATTRLPMVIWVGPSYSTRAGMAQSGGKQSFAALDRSDAVVPQADLSATRNPEFIH